MLKHRLIPGGTFCFMYWLDARKFILVFYNDTLQGFQNIIEIQAINVFFKKHWMKGKAHLPRKSWNCGPKSTLNPISLDILCYHLPAKHHLSFYWQASEWMTMNLLLYPLESACLNASELLTNLSLSTHREIAEEDILYSTCPELFHLVFHPPIGVYPLPTSPHSWIDFWTTSLTLLCLQLLVVSLFAARVNHCTQLKRT